MRKSSRRFAGRRRRSAESREQPAYLGGPNEAGIIRPGTWVEKDEQREVVKLYQALGCEVVSFSQPRATMQTEGIPDLRIYCRRKAIAWWHETKRPGGKQSPDQKLFQELAEVCNESYVLGGFEAAVEHVQKLGLVAPEWRPARA